MTTIFCGIDPGLGGALGFVTADGAFHAVEDAPTLATPAGRRMIDPAGLADTILRHAPAFALVERVGARPGEGVASSFSFGQTFGAILGVLAALKVPYDLIQPAAWKRRAGIPAGADKAVSIASAKRLLPDASPHLSRAKDHGRAEALLLANQARAQRLAVSLSAPKEPTPHPAHKETQHG